MAKTLKEIKPCSAGIMDVFNKGTCLFCAIAYSAFLIDLLLKGKLEMSLGVIGFALAVILLSICIFIALSYTEVDDEHIGRVIRVGSRFHFEYASIQWGQVSKAELRQSTRPSLAYLRITTLNGKRRSFSVSPYSEAAKEFVKIAHHFGNHGSRLEHMW